MQFLNHPFGYSLQYSFGCARKTVNQGSIPASEEGKGRRTWTKNRCMLHFRVS